MTRIRPQVDNRSLFLAVCGDSGIGKTTLVDAIVDQYPERFERPTSYTTRDRRLGELDNEYVFVNQSKFDSLRNNDKLMNDDHVFGNRYGIDRAKFENILTNGRIPVKEMSIRNACAFRAQGLYVAIVYLKSSDNMLLREGRVQDSENFQGMPMGDVRDVIYCPHREEPHIVAENVFRWIQGLILFDSLGILNSIANPEWDRFNQVGYDGIAVEFTDEFRVTTSYFHEVSKPFWGRIFTEKILRNGEYLEIGPGRGWLTTTFPWNEQAIYRGIDISEQMIAYHPFSERVDVGSVDHLPYSSGRFDGVFGSLVDPLTTPNALIEVRRVLRRGGWFAFTIPAKEWAERLRDSENLQQTTFVRSDGCEFSVGSNCLRFDHIKPILVAGGFGQLSISSIELPLNRQSIAPPAIQSTLPLDGDAQGQLLRVIHTVMCHRT